MVSVSLRATKIWSKCDIIQGYYKWSVHFLEKYFEEIVI